VGPTFGAKWSKLILFSAEQRKMGWDAAESAFRREYGYSPTAPDEIAEAEELADVPEEYRTQGEETTEEVATRLVGERSADGDAGAGGDALGVFEENGLGAMSLEAVDGLTDQIRARLEAGEELSPSEELFLEERMAGGYAGESDGDPIFEWQERQFMREPGVEEETALESGARSVLRNVGWSDAARAASLAVRRAKVGARVAGKMFAAEDRPSRMKPKRPGDRAKPKVPRVPMDEGGMYWPGGSPYFDERTGRYVFPRKAVPRRVPVKTKPKRPPHGPPVYMPLAADAVGLAKREKRKRSAK